MEFHSQFNIKLALSAVVRGLRKFPVPIGTRAIGSNVIGGQPTEVDQAEVSMEPAPFGAVLGAIAGG